MKCVYTGTEEKVLPTLNLTVKPGDEVEAENLTDPDFEPVKPKGKTEASERGNK